jgi:peptidoglycan/xylan/chitin deacetylase (PgdA/CDA1 family)
MDEGSTQDFVQNAFQRAVPMQVKFPSERSEGTWVIRTHGRIGLVSTRYDDEEAARSAFRWTLRSAVLFGPTGQVVEQKAGWLDMKANSHLEIINRVQQRSKTCPFVFEEQWTLGTHCRGGVSWEVFATESDALRRYSACWWSKVLFGPDGVPRYCSTGSLDRKGAGVATVLQVHRDREDRASETAVKEDMKLGAAPFIPRTAREGQHLKGAVIKRVWRLVGRRAVMNRLMPNSLCYFDARINPQVEGLVALTIDDAPCRLGHKNSMIAEVRNVLREFEASATFMVMGKFIQGSEDDLVSLLSDGHELGNHGLVDRAYHKDEAADFGRAVDECTSSLLELQRKAGVPEHVRWFRAPHGRSSGTMTKVLEDRGLRNVMCDTYACCPVIQDAEFIGNFLASSAHDGSVIVIHMPEHGFREWCLEGLRICLRGLRARGLRAVTVGHIADLVGENPVVDSCPDHAGERV